VKRNINIYHVPVHGDNELVGLITYEDGKLNSEGLGTDYLKEITEIGLTYPTKEGFKTIYLKEDNVNEVLDALLTRGSSRLLIVEEN